MDLTELEQKAVVLARELTVIQSQIDKQRLIHIKSVYGISFGSVVVCNKDKYLVSEINPYTEPPLLKGKPLKKDGTFSKVNRYLGDKFKVFLS